MAGGDAVVVGYWYSAGMHYCACYGPVDAVLQVRVGDRIAWNGSQTDSGTISINKESLFGGESREGGLRGTLKVKMGKPTQTSADFKGSGTKPAYRGILSLLWNGYYSALNPYMKPWAFKVKRILKGWHNDSCWYPEKAVITISGVDHMNPAHIIYQCLTDPEWGMGYPTSSIDDVAFTEAADQLYTEAFGLSLMWNQQGKVQNFINEVLDHIHGVVRNDPATGKFVLKLVRNDYVAGDLEEFDESSIMEVEEYARISWGETINEVTVKYIDQVNGKMSAVTVHELANVQSQGAVISKTNQYSGIGNYDLAIKVAMRDLKMASSPLAKFKLKINRMAWRLLPGDVFKISFPKLGVESVVLRVMDCSIGTLDSNVVTVSAMEDVFALPSAVYVGQEPIGWEDPANEPAESPSRLVTEMPYWTLARNLGTADFATVNDEDCYLCVLAEKPSSDALAYRLHTRIDPAAFVDKGGNTHCPSATITNSMDYNDIAIDYINASNIDVVVVGSLAVIKSAAGYECVKVSSIDIDNDSLTVSRGVLDTVPIPHEADSIIYFAQGFEATDRIVYLDTEEVDVKVQTTTGRGVLDIDDAPVDSVIMGNRFARPYPPARLRFYQSYYGSFQAYPGWIVGELQIDWRHRDRTQQTADLIDGSSASIGPEAGVTYTLQIFGGAGTLLREITGITADTYTYAKATEESDTIGIYNHQLRIVLKAVRDAYESWTEYDITNDRAGYGYNYGLYYGAGT